MEWLTVVLLRSTALLSPGLIIQVLQDVTADEFIMFMTILSSLKCMQTLQGRQQLVGIISEQAGFDTNFEVTLVNLVHHIMYWLKCTMWVWRTYIFSKAAPFFYDLVDEGLIDGVTFVHSIFFVIIMENCFGQIDFCYQICNQLMCSKIDFSWGYHLFNTSLPALCTQNSTRIWNLRVGWWVLCRKLEDADNSSDSLQNVNINFT